MKEYSVCDGNDVATGGSLPLEHFSTLFIFDFEEIELINRSISFDRAQIYFSILASDRESSNSMC